VTADEIHQKQIDHERVEKIKRDRLNGLLEGLGQVERLDWTHGKETTTAEYRQHCYGDLAHILADAEAARKAREAAGEE
jgi:hypothetical protein